jgi:HEAT repeat protein
MYRTSIVLAIVSAILLGATTVPAADQPIYGPVKYDVKERYGRLNTYTASFPATDGLYLIKFQNGETPAERSDYLQLSVNGQPVVPDGRYAYRYFACFLDLRKENTLTVVIRDERPSGMRRPPPIPKNVILTVLPVPAGMKTLRGSFGIFDWATVKDINLLFDKIKGEQALRLAMDASSVHLSVADRAAALRTLSDLKVKSAEDYLVRAVIDPYYPSEVRAEATLALAVLGNVKNLPLFIQNVMDPDDLISTASARALSFFPESETGRLLTQMLEKLDPLRKSATIHAIIEAGWKPVQTVIAMSGSADPYVADMAISLLGSMRDARATEHLLAMMGEPGQKRSGAIVSALAETSDPRALDALLAMAADPERRAGKEVELGDALARLGGERSAEAIGQMIRKAPSPQAEYRLRSAYRRLTGKDF